MERNIGDKGENRRNDVRGRNWVRWQGARGRLRRFFLGLGGAQCGADEVLAWSDGAVIPAIVFRGTGLELSLS